MKIYKIIFFKAHARASIKKKADFAHSRIEYHDRHFCIKIDFLVGNTTVKKIPRSDFPRPEEIKLAFDLQGS